ncbi:hypothetical protein SISSUDRAFT_583755 [Sistotremastrum suecicum HHB10207 ss-3]|uniref:Uncharacterized protein n=1 Tax=Sistotremastrum suecicum HHB10207 ss-3 TaxID=1314776 RepID=A0A165XEV4_9AGAM|nr:hypothetical protein SISSUDRAFT_583755 [Sistotremastrum suecicum HHB10207 ss-3]
MDSHWIRGSLSHAATVQIVDGFGTLLSHAATVHSLHTVTPSVSKPKSRVSHHHQSWVRISSAPSIGHGHARARFPPIRASHAMGGPAFTISPLLLIFLPLLMLGPFS